MSPDFHFDISGAGSYQLLEIVMKRQLAFASIAALIWAPVFADSPHFIKGPTGTISGGDYIASFKEAGLGSTPVTYSLTAGTEQFTFQCYNPAGNTPEGAPNGQSFSDQSTFETLTPHNGQITGSISLSPQVGTASCQGKSMQLCLIAASYTNVVFQDVTNGLTVNLPSLSADYSSHPICGF